MNFNGDYTLGAPLRLPKSLRLLKNFEIRQFFPESDGPLLRYPVGVFP